MKQQLRHRNYAMRAPDCGEFCITTNIQWFIQQARDWFSGKARKERGEFNAKLSSRNERRELTVFWPLKEGRILMDVAA